MVRDDDRSRAVLHRKRRVLPREQPLQDDGHAAFGRDPVEVGPRDRGAHLQVLLERHRHRRVLALDVWERQVGGKVEAEPEIALAPPEVGHVDGEHERRVAALTRLGDVIECALPIAEDVELQPARSVAGGFRDLVVRTAGDRRDAHHRAERGGCARCCNFAFRIEQPVHRERRHEQGHRDRRPEDGRGGRDGCDVDEDARAEQPASVRRAVRTQRHLVPGSPLEVAPDFRVDGRGRALEVVRDADELAHVSNLSRAFAAI